MKNYRILFILTCLYFSKAFAQSKHSTLEQNCPSHYDSLLHQNIYLFPDSLASFPGGTTALYRFINTKLNYPLEGNVKTGTLLVKCLVDTTGKLVDIKILKGLDEQMNTEALRVVKSMPLWIPATCRGKKVVSETIIPVKFKIR